MSLEDRLVLGRYRVLWQMDQKKLVRTYLARDEHREESGTPVLIKHFLHDLGDQKSPLVTALFAELRALEQLRHPGVVPLLGHGVVQDCLITAHAHRPGLSLAQLCEAFERRNEPFPAHLAVYLVRCLLRTLQDCHTRPERPFIHGRITLGCIHLPSHGEPQLADFGLARLEDVAAEAESQLGFFQTRMSYAAPELTQGGAPTPRGDTYSLGLLLYRLLSGTNPFRGRSIPETLQRVLQHTPAALHMPSWSHVAEANLILMRMLAKDPEQRYQSCDELYRALSTLQTTADEVLAEELSNVVRNNGNADWARVAHLTRAVRKSAPPRIQHVTDEGAAAPPAERAVAGAPFESGAPAFVSGLVTEQPRSASEHTMRDARARAKQRAQRRAALIPTVLIPAVGTVCGLILGSLGSSGGNTAAPRAASDGVQLVDGSVAELRTRLDGCADKSTASRAQSKIELEFAATGQLSEVRLSPREMGHTRLGACLLETAWQAKLTAPGAMSVVIPLVEP